eukprot:tig00000057_g161.t1
MTKGHSMMDIGEGSKKQRQSLKNDLKGEVTGIIEKYAPGTILPEVPVPAGKGDVYTPEDVARGLGQSTTDTKALPAMKYTPQMEKLMRMGIRQQLQNAYPNRQINEEDVENAFTLRKEIMIRDFDQWAMTAFDLKQPGVAKMLEEYYPELLERITNMIEQDIEIQRFDVDFSKGNPFGAILMDQQGTRGPAIPTATPYADQNILPATVNPIQGLGDGIIPGAAASQIQSTRGRGTVAGMSSALNGPQMAIQAAFQALVLGTETAQQNILRETNTRKAEAYTAAAAALQPGR